MEADASASRYLTASSRAARSSAAKAGRARLRTTKSTTTSRCIHYPLGRRHARRGRASFAGHHTKTAPRQSRSRPLRSPSPVACSSRRTPAPAPRRAPPRGPRAGAPPCGEGSPGPDGQRDVGLPVLGAAAADLGGGLGQIQLERDGGRQLLGRGLADLRPAPAADVLDQGPRRGHLLGGVRHLLDAPQHDDRAVGPPGRSRRAGARLPSQPPLRGLAQQVRLPLPRQHLEHSVAHRQPPLYYN